MRMCERLMGSIDLLKACRQAYSSKAGFDEHSTTRHSFADPFHDQIKGAWFCLKHGLLNPMVNEGLPCSYALDGGGKPTGKVQSSYLMLQIKVSQKFLKISVLSYTSPFLS